MEANGSAATDTKLVFDRAESMHLLEMYRQPDVVARRREVLHALRLKRGERLLDAGCGPGLLGLEASELVGPSGSVVGVDRSVEMLAIAREQASHLGRVSFREGDLGTLPADDAEFDAVACVQVLEYVDDVAQALSEFRRVLRPGGRLIVWDTDWDAIIWQSDDDDRMDAVLTAFEGHLAHPRLPRILPRLLRDAGFESIRPTAYPMLCVSPGRHTYAGGLADLIEKFVRDHHALPESLIGAWREDVRSQGPNTFFCVMQFYFVAEVPIA